MPTAKTHFSVAVTIDLPQVDLMNFRVEYVRPRSGIYLNIRPGQGFWVYGILGLFISGIWYFLV